MMFLLRYPYVPGESVTSANGTVTATQLHPASQLHSATQHTPALLSGASRGPSGSRVSAPLGPHSSPSHGRGPLGALGAKAAIGNGLPPRNGSVLAFPYTSPLLGSPQRPPPPYSPRTTHRPNDPRYVFTPEAMSAPGTAV